MNSRDPESVLSWIRSQEVGASNISMTKHEHACIHVHVSHPHLTCTNRTRCWSHQCSCSKSSPHTPLARPVGSRQTMCCRQARSTSQQFSLHRFHVLALESGLAVQVAKDQAESDPVSVWVWVWARHTCRRLPWPMAAGWCSRPS